MKILPPGMTFEQCVRLGYTGRIEAAPYLAWLRTLPCHTCNAPPPSEASHVNGIKGGSTKSPDWFSIPECTTCNRNYDLQPPMVEQRLCIAIFYLLRANYEGRLVWKATPKVEDDDPWPDGVIDPEDSPEIVPPFHVGGVPGWRCIVDSRNRALTEHEIVSRLNPAAAAR